jgi:hypothetical protein
MAFFHAGVAEDADEGNELEVVFDLVGEPVEHLERAFQGRALLVLLVAADLRAGQVEAVDKFNGLGVHLLYFLLNGLQGQLEDRGFDPRVVVVVETAHHAP